MRVYLAILLIAATPALACIMQKKEANPTEASAHEFSAGEKIDFGKQVQPVLEKNCSPCHFTGGKMYEKLPFDKDTTFLNHSEAILKRIKDEKENAVLKTFVLQNKTNPSQAGH